MGQFRGFSLKEYLSDVSDGSLLPWSIGDGVLPDSEAEKGVAAAAKKAQPADSEGPINTVAAFEAQLGDQLRQLRNNMFAVGISPEVRVLFVPDYVASSERVSKTAELSRLLRTAFPESIVKVALAEAPFEDTEGNSCHFEKHGKQNLTGRKLVNATRVDLMTSVATLLRGIAQHNPSIVVGIGQGAVIGLAAASPVVIEAVMLLRNVQIGEAQRLANAWSQVNLIVGVNPRIGKSKPGSMLLKEACPEWFKPHPLESIPRLGVLDVNVLLKEEMRELLS